MKNILPTWLYNLIAESYNEEFIYEIRIRLHKPILINYKGDLYRLLKENGYLKQPVIANMELINYIFSLASKQSLYAFEEQIKKGYISTDNGIRIGICGILSYDNGKVLGIKKITSLNIRIAHIIKDCSNRIINFLVGYDGIKNTLIISPPGAGKTTLLRDLIIKFSEEKDIENILVIDERYELAGFNQQFNLGANVDVVSGSNKNFAFNNLIKVMNPSVIIADEISDEEDIDSLKIASKSGVNVVATAHATEINDLLNKRLFKELIDKNYFERIIVLSKRRGVGTIEKIYNENQNILYEAP